MDNEKDPEVMPHVFAAMVILACVPRAAREQSLAMLEAIVGGESYREVMDNLTAEFALGEQQLAYMKLTGKGGK